MKKLSWIVGSSLALALAASITINCLQYKSKENFNTKLWNDYRKITCSYARIEKTFPISGRDSKEFMDALDDHSRDIRNFNTTLGEYGQ